MLFTCLQASVITSKHHCPMRLICLDEESLSAIPEQPGNPIVEPESQKTNVKITHKEYQDLTNDLYLFTESDEDWRSPPSVAPDQAPTESVPLEDPSVPVVATVDPRHDVDQTRDIPTGENDIEDLFEGMEDPF